MRLINGRKLAHRRLKALRSEVAKLDKRPGLAVILIGDDKPSRLYVSLKEHTSNDVGIYFEKYEYPKDVTETEILDRIGNLNGRNDIHGIVVQLPIPGHLSESAIIAAIDSQKDVDGFQQENIQRFLEGDIRWTPSLFRSIFDLLALTKVDLRNKRIVIIGKSTVFTNPMKSIFRTWGSVVFVAHTKGEALEPMSGADVIITALGKPKWITGDMISTGSVIIDVGISPVDDSFVGDVDKRSVRSKAAWLTPVPGGVGPMTVAALLENTVEAYRRLRR